MPPPVRPDRSRAQRGNALLLVLGVAMLLACELAIVGVFSSGNVRQAGRMASQLHAVAIGESAFGHHLARLRADPWESRSFRRGAVSEADIPLYGGRYASYVAEAPDEPRVAEIWIRASYEDASVAMFWRVRVADDALDLRSRLAATFFTFLSPDSPPPTAGTRTREAVDRMRREAAANRPAAVALARQAAAARSFADVAAAVRLSPAPAVPAAGFPLPGSAAVPTAVYLAGLPAPRPPPPLTAAPPPPTELAAAHPTPVDFTAVITAVFASAGLPPPGTIDGAHFADPLKAREEWNAAIRLTATDVRDPRWVTLMEHCRAYLSELAARGSSGCGACSDAMGRLLAYLEEVTARRVAVGGVRPPAPAEVDPHPFDASGYARAIGGYTAWWQR